MPRNVYAEINLHLTWHTLNSTPVITPALENRLYHYLQHRALKETGLIFHGIGGTENHVHLVISVPPSLLISKWVGEMKGASSHYINHEIAKRKVLDWQTGYGVVSFGTKDLAWVVRYVQNQKQHHARGRVYDRLERIVGTEG